MGKSAGVTEAAFQDIVSDLKKFLLTHGTSIPGYTRPGVFQTRQAQFIAYILLKSEDGRRQLVVLAGKNPDAFVALKWGLAEKNSKEEELSEDERRW